MINYSIRVTQLVSINMGPRKNDSGETTSDFGTVHPQPCFTLR
jgi:hypothetical protein